MTSAGRRPRRWTPSRALVLLGACAVSACAGAAADRPVRHEVTIENFVFVPETLQVSVGDTVVWLNRDVVPHTATSSGWDTGEIGARGEGSIVVGGAGTVDYICTLHPVMKGVLIATE